MIIEAPLEGDYELQIKILKHLFKDLTFSLEEKDRKTHSYKLLYKREEKELCLSCHFKRS